MSSGVRRAAPGDEAMVAHAGAEKRRRRPATGRASLARPARLRRRHDDQLSLGLEYADVGSGIVAGGSDGITARISGAATRRKRRALRTAARPGAAAPVPARSAARRPSRCQRPGDHLRRLRTRASSSSRSLGSMSRCSASWATSGEIRPPNNLSTRPPGLTAGDRLARDRRSIAKPPSFALGGDRALRDQPRQQGLDRGQAPAAARRARRKLGRAERRLVPQQLQQLRSASLIRLACGPYDYKCSHRPEPPLN